MTETTAPDLNTDVARLLAWQRRMIEIRLFEEKVQELFMQGLVEGTTHLCQGQEAVSVGAVAALRPDDFLTITYRGHGHALARGMSMESAFAELMGRKGGCCGGVGGSMHLTDFSRGLIGSFAIIGAGLSVAVGASLSARLRGTDQVAIAFFGDGATNIGSFHEALNMAATWQTPTVFVIENNLYAEYTPLRETTPLDDLARRADAHDMPSAIVDGQDVLSVHAAVAGAILRARQGDGPTLLEMKTYRFRGHSRTDPAKYRPVGELDTWLERDPITLFGHHLQRAGHVSSQELIDLHAEVQVDVDAAADRAAESPIPTLREIQEYVYTG